MQLTEYLKDIADAIRENTGKTDPIAAQNFKDEITKFSELDAGVYAFSVGSGGTSVNDVTVNTLPGNLVLAFVCTTTEVTYPDLEGWTKIEPSIVSNTNRITDEKMDIWYKITESTTETIHIVTSASTNLATALMSFKNMQIVPILDQVKGGHSATFTNIKKGDLICCVNPWYNMGSYMKEPYSINIKCNKYLGWYKYYFTIFEALEDVASATVSSGNSFYNGYGVLQMNRPTLSNSLKAGVTHGKTVGTFTSDATATVNDIVGGKTAYVNGEKVQGAMLATTAENPLVISGDYTALDQENPYFLLRRPSGQNFLSDIIKVNATAIPQEWIEGKNMILRYNFDSSTESGQLELVTTDWGNRFAFSYNGGKLEFSVRDSLTGESRSAQSYYCTSTKEGLLTLTSDKWQGPYGGNLLGDIKTLYAYSRDESIKTTSHGGSDGIPSNNQMIAFEKNITGYNGRSVYAPTGGKEIVYLQKPIIATEENITAEKIIAGNTVLGIQGNAMEFIPDPTFIAGAVEKYSGPIATTVKVHSASNKSEFSYSIPATVGKRVIAFMSLLNNSSYTTNPATPNEIEGWELVHRLQSGNYNNWRNWTTYIYTKIAENETETITFTTQEVCGAADIILAAYDSSEEVEVLASVTGWKALTGYANPIKVGDIIFDAYMTVQELTVNGPKYTSYDNKRAYLLVADTEADQVSLNRKYDYTHNTVVLRFKTQDMEVLKPENIKKGVKILNIQGSLEEKIDTSDATVTSGDIVEGKIAYANDEKIVGTLKEVAQGASTVETYDAVTADETNRKLKVSKQFADDKVYRAGSGISVDVAYNEIATTTKLTPEKLVQGETVLGITGTAIPLSSTLDATATINDISQGKTAYVNGVKITGTLMEAGKIGLVPTTMTKDGSGYEVTSHINGEYIVRNIDTNMILSNKMIADAIELTSDKILTGQTVLGIDGTGKSGIDTDTATAKPSDIAAGVTAVVNNTLITGTVKTIEGNVDTRLNMSGAVSTSGNSKILTGQAELEGDTLFRDGAKFSVQYNMNNYASQLGVSPEKVVLGHNILGVEGTGLGLDTSDATARATDLALGETAYVNNQKITGTLQEIATGSHRLTSETIIGMDGTDLIFTADNTIDRIVRKDVDLTIGASQSAVAAAIGLTAPKIIQGQTILGIEGTADVTLELDTFDATAIAADLREGKTAYVAGEKITGTSKEISTLETRVKTTTEDGNGKIYFQANEVAEGFYTPNTVIKLEMTTAELASRLGITADVIKEGVTILGITGTHKGESEPGGETPDPENPEQGGGTTTTVVTYPSYDNLVQDTTQKEGTMGLVDNTAYVATNSGTVGQTMWVPTVTYNDAQAAYSTLSEIGTDEAATSYDGMGGTEEEIQATFNEIM